MSKNNKVKLFISYSHKDEEIKNKLDMHLSSLKRSDKILTWNDRGIIPGQEWDNEIKNELDRADVILLLISADFIASNYIWEFEVAKAIERHQSKSAVVIPIFCKPCDYTDMPFAGLQGLPKDAKPISSHPNIDEALTEAAKGIRLVVNHLTTNNFEEKKVLNNIPIIQNELYFKFKPDFRADIVSVSDAINKMVGGKEKDFEFKISWSNEISKAIEVCQNVYEKAKNYLDSSSIFYNCDEKLVESLINTVPSHINSAEFTLNNAHKRIIPLIEGVSYERYSVLGCKKTILNYLTHCNVNALKTVLYPLTHILLKDTEYYYKNMANNFDEALFYEKGFYKYVYGMRENIESTSLWYLPNKEKENFANVKRALNVVGNKEDLDDGLKDYNFYDNIFVPQIEFQLIGSEEVALYQQDSKLYLKEHINKI